MKERKPPAFQGAEVEGFVFKAQSVIIEITMKGQFYKVSSLKYASTSLLPESVRDRLYSVVAALF